MQMYLAFRPKDPHHSDAEKPASGLKTMSTVRSQACDGRSPTISGREPGSSVAEVLTTKPDPNPATTEAASPYPFTPSSTAPSSPTNTTGFESPAWFLPPLCRTTDCPIKVAHHEGIYRHNGKNPENACTVFGPSNPPPHIWEIADKVQEGKDTVKECDWLIVFLRLHADIKVFDHPDTPMTAVSP